MNAYGVLVQSLDFGRSNTLHPDNLTTYSAFESKPSTRDHRLLKYLFSVGLLLFTVLCQAEELAIALHPFKSTYKLMGWGILEVERTVSLSRTNNHYVLTSINEPRGLALLAGYGQVVEISKFTTAFSHIQPLSYRNNDQTGISDLDDSIDFDWDNKLVRSRRKEQSFEFPLVEPVLDPLTVELSARLDLAKGARELTYLVHEIDQIRTYHISRLPMETIRVDEHEFVCVHLIVDTERPNRQLHYWMAPELAYLPIQIKQFNDGSLEFIATLISSSLLP